MKHQRQQPQTLTPRNKLVIVGDGACGKTCLLVVFSTNKFPEEYVPTVFETYTTTIKLPEQSVLMSLWDTAGQEDYDRLRPLSYSDTDVVLIAFAVDSRQTLDNVFTKWIGEVRHYAPGVPIILVACKTDIRENTAGCTTFEQGKEVAQQIGVMYAECSALTGAGVKAVFEAAARLSAAHSAVKRKGNKRGGNGGCKSL